MRSTIHTKLTKLISGILFSGFLISFPVYAEEAKTSVDLIAEIAPTLQVIIPSSISLNLTPNLDGSPVFVSEDLNILVATNNPTGYHLSLQTNSTNLTNNQKDKEGNYPVLETISSELSEADFTVNRWGYKYNTTNYLPFQTNINLNQTTNPTNEDNITLTFGAKADITKPAGTYSLALNFHAVTNMIPGVETIVFNPNLPAGTTTLPQGNIVLSNNEITTLKIEKGQSSTLPQYTGTRTYNNVTSELVFNGWNTKPDGTGISYTDFYNTGAVTTTNTETTLYAMWGVNYLGDSTYMQGSTQEQCNNSYNGSKATLIDSRDSNTYTIAKINGNCWMTQNLRLVISAGTKLSATTTNIASDYTFGTVQDLYSAAGNNYVNVAAVKNSGNTETGYWYNYFAVTAGAVNSGSNTSTVIYDICPKGWKIPTTSQTLTISGEEQIGATEQAWNTIYTDIFNPITEGYYGNGGIIYPGIYGIYWTSISYDSVGRHYVLKSRANPLGLLTGQGWKAHGYYVRCLQKS